MQTEVVFTTEFLTTHVTAVHASCGYLFVGIGDSVEVVHLISRRTVARVVPMPGFNVTGIYSHQGQIEQSLLLVVSVARFIVTYKFEDERLKLTLGPVNLLDWILHVSFSEQSIEQLSLLCITSRNQLITFDCRSGLVQRLIRCPITCIIYSAHVLLPEPGLTDTGASEDRAPEILVASGTVFKEIVIWDASPNQAAPGKLIARLTGHEGVIFAVKFSRQKSLLASASDDRSVKIWKADLNNVSKSAFVLLFNLFNHSSRIWSIDFHDSTLISCGESGNVCFWSLTDGSLVHKDESGDSSYWCLAICHESGHAYLGCSDGSVSSIDIAVRTAAPSTRESVHCSPKLISFVETSSGLGIMSVNDRGLVVLWDEEMQKPVASHQLPCESFSNAYVQMTKIPGKRGGCCFMFGGDCGKLIKLLFDQSLIFWVDYETRTGYSSKIVSLTSSSSSSSRNGNERESRVAACDSGNWLHLFQTKSGEKLLTLYLHRGIHVPDRGVASVATGGKVTASLSNTFDTEEDNKHQLSHQVTREKGTGSGQLHAIKRWPSCSLTGSGFFIVGDVSGSVRSFAWDLALESSTAIPLSGNQVKETSSFNRIHGPKGVTVLHRDARNSLIYSAGRDGKIRIWMLQEEKSDGHCTSSSLMLMRTFRNFTGQLSWIGKLLFTDSLMSQASQKRHNELRYVIGFVADKFVIYDDANESTVLRMGCGGGHRCWDALVSQSQQRCSTPAAEIVTVQTKPASQHHERGLDGSDITHSSRGNKAIAHFAYIKERRIIWVSKEVEGDCARESETTESLKWNDMRDSNQDDETTSTSWRRRIRQTNHTDQITCCIALILPDRVTCEATSSGSRNDVLFVTGSEDTQINIYSGSWPHVPNDGSAVVKKLTTLTGHISSVRALCSHFDADRNGWIMISAGGRSQLMAWSIDNNLCTKGSRVRVQQLLNHFLWNSDRKKSDQTIESSTNQKDPQDQQELEFQIRFTDCRIRKLIPYSAFNDTEGKVVSKAAFDDNNEVELFQILTTSSDGKVRVFKLTLGKESRNISMIFLISPHITNNVVHAGMQLVSKQQQQQSKQNEEWSEKADAERHRESSDNQEEGMAHASCLNRISLPHDPANQHNGDKDCGDFFITGSNSGYLQIWSSVSEATIIDHQRAAESDPTANYDSASRVRSTGNEDVNEEEIKMDASRKKGDVGESGSGQVQADGGDSVLAGAAARSPLLRSSNPDMTRIKKPEGSSSQPQFLVQARNRDADIRSIVTCQLLLEAGTSAEKEERAAGSGETGKGSDSQSAYIISTGTGDHNHMSRYRHPVSHEADNDDCISRSEKGSHSDCQERKRNESEESFASISISCCGEIEHQVETDTSFNTTGTNGTDQSSPAAHFEAVAAQASESSMLLHSIRYSEVPVLAPLALKSLSLHSHTENRDERRHFMFPVGNNCKPRDQSEAGSDDKQPHGTCNVSGDDGNCSDSALRYDRLRMREGKIHHPPERCLHKTDTQVVTPVTNEKSLEKVEACGNDGPGNEENDCGGKGENDGQRRVNSEAEAGEEKAIPMMRERTPETSLSCTADYSCCQVIAAHQTGLVSLDTKHLLFRGEKNNHRLLLIASGGDDNALSIIVTDFPYQNAAHGLSQRSIHPPLRVLTRTVISDAHDSLISGVAFSADRFLISVSIDQRVKVWRYELKRTSSHQSYETGVSDLNPADKAPDAYRESEKGLEISASLVGSALTCISDVCGLNLVTKDPNSSIWTLIVFGQGFEVISIHVNAK